MTPTPHSRPITALLSDADGTLVDTMQLVRRGLYKATVRYLKSQGVSPANVPSFAAYQKFLLQVIGTSARETIEDTVRLMYETAPEQLMGLDFDAMYTLLDPIQDEMARTQVAAYPEAVKWLTRLGAAGLKFGIVTSGTPYQTVRNFGLAMPELGCAELYLERTAGPAEQLRRLERAMSRTFGIARVTIVTCDDLHHGKPHPEGLYLAMTRLEVDPEECAMMGDSRYDMEAAVRGGVSRRIGVTHGFHSQAELEDAGATTIIHRLDELESVVLH